MTNKNDLTVEEAIIELNRCKINGYAPTDWDRRCKAVELAKMALRKLIKQKIELEMIGFIIVPAGVCPKCHVRVRSDANFCDNCGQALDWND